MVELVGTRVARKRVSEGMKEEGAEHLEWKIVKKGRGAFREGGQGERR